MAVCPKMYTFKGNHGGKPYVRRERFVDTWILKTETGCAWQPMQHRSRIERRTIVLGSLQGAAQIEDTKPQGWPSS